MTRSASLPGEDHANIPSADSDRADWLRDEDQLATWQEQLVDSCHEISRQLTEIQSDLHRDLSPAIPFRLIRAVQQDDFAPRLA